MNSTSSHLLLPQPVMRLGLGLILYGVSIALMLAAGLGVDSWDVLHQGLSHRTGISFGWIVNGLSVVVLLLWIPLRRRPGFGTLANALVVGSVADFTLGVLATPGSMLGRLAMLVIGVVANGIATGLYIGAGLGPGPRDGLMTGLSARTGRSIRSVRTGIEIIVLAIGWSLGGPVGLGTVLYAASIGALSQYFIAKLSLTETESDQQEAPVVRASTPLPAVCGQSRAWSGDSKQETQNEPATI